MISSEWPRALLIGVSCQYDASQIWIAGSKKDRFTITVDKSHTVAQLVSALLANSKVPGSSAGGVTEDFFFLSYLACKC